jgi:hypothetical protein
MILVYSRRDFLAQGFQTLSRLPSLVGKSWLSNHEPDNSAPKSSYRYLGPTDEVILSRLLPVILGVRMNLSDPEDQKLLVHCLQIFDYKIRIFPIIFRFFF